MKSIIFGILFIIAGASGQFVFRGTDSSALLVVAGVISIIIGIINLVRKSGSRESAEE